MLSWPCAFVFLALVASLIASERIAFERSSDWPNYGNDPGGQRYSSLSEINRSNVQNLKVAWTYRTGDAYQPKDSKPTAFETTPLYVDGTLYIGTPLGSVIALDPVTGKERWAFHTDVNKDAGYGDYSSQAQILL